MIIEIVSLALMIVSYLVFIVFKSDLVMSAAVAADYCGQVCARFSNAAEPEQNLCGPSGSQCTAGLCTNLYWANDEGGVRGLMNSEVEGDLTEAEMADPLTCFTAQQVLGLPPTIRGIRDVGNTCYLNTALQLLIHLRPVREILAATEGTSPFLDMFRGLMANVDSGNAALDVSSVGIRDALNANGFAGFERGVLGDSSEAIAAIINMIDTTEEPRFSSLFGIDYNVVRRCETCGVERSRVDGPSLLFEVRLNPADDSNDQVNLGDLLHQSLHQVEHIDAICPHEPCSGGSVVYRSETRVNATGEILMISLGRVRYDGSRINTPVTFPTTLEHALLSRNYRLVGVSNHVGPDARRGHYFANLMHEGTWFRIDNLAVTPLPFPGQSITSTEAALLIYERI
jgi:hypothetical protein